MRLRQFMITLNNPLSNLDSSEQQQTLRNIIFPVEDSVRAIIFNEKEILVASESEEYFQEIPNIQKIADVKEVYEHYDDTDEYFSINNEIADHVDHMWIRTEDTPYNIFAHINFYITHRLCDETNLCFLINKKVNDIDNDFYICIETTNIKSLTTIYMEDVEFNAPNIRHILPDMDIHFSESQLTGMKLNLWKTAVDKFNELNIQITPETKGFMVFKDNCGIFFLKEEKDNKVQYRIVDMRCSSNASGQHLITLVTSTVTNLVLTKDYIESLFNGWNKASKSEEVKIKPEPRKITFSLDCIIEDAETTLITLQEIEKHELTVTLKPCSAGIEFTYYDVDEKLAFEIVKVYAGHLDVPNEDISSEDMDDILYYMYGSEYKLGENEHDLEGYVDYKEIKQRLGLPVKY